MLMKEITLETERLLLRWLREDDFERYSKICRDPDVMRFLGGQLMTDIEVYRNMGFETQRRAFLCEPLQNPPRPLRLDFAVDCCTAEAS